MFWIIVFIIFGSINFGCREANGQEDELRELVLPADQEGEVDGNQSAIGGVLKRFNINFLRKQLKPPSRSSVSSRAWSTVTQLVSSPKYLYTNNPYPKACQSRWVRGKVTVTEVGEKQCLDKCLAENEAYIKQANVNLPHLFKIMNMSHLKAEFQSVTENIHECAPGFIYGYTCICKHNAKAFVNAELQGMVDQVYAVKGEAGDGENVDPRKALDNERKTQFIGRFLGLFACLIYFPTWLRSYIAWWASGPK